MEAGPNILSKLAMTAALVVVAPAVDAAELTLRVAQVPSAQGSVLACLWSQPEGFPDCSGPEPQARRTETPAQPGTVTLSFDDVAPGTYAVSVLHDVNGNRALDTNALQVPTEGWAASNDPRPVALAPSYDDAAFQVTEQAEQTVSVNLDNPD